ISLSHSRSRLSDERLCRNLSTSPLSSRAKARNLRQISPFRSKQGFLVVLEMTRQVTDTQSPLFCPMLRWQRTEGSGAESCVTPHPDRNGREYTPLLGRVLLVRSASEAAFT